MLGIQTAAAAMPRHVASEDMVSLIKGGRLAMNDNRNPYHLQNDPPAGKEPDICAQTK